MSQSVHTQRGLWGTCAVLGLTVAVVVCVLLVMNNRADSNPAVLETSEPSTAVSSSLPTPITEVTEVAATPQLPRLDFLPGSVEEACGLNEFPTYWFARGGLSSNWGHHIKALESDDCRAALEAHMTTTNPYHFLMGGPQVARLAEFLVLENPLTFERIFEEPSVDLARMQNALARPECLLVPTETNWELEESCHADAFVNYALVNLFCFGGGVENRFLPVRKGERDPTVAQDRLLWKQELEGEWVTQKCEKLDPTLEFTPEHYPELHALVMSLHEPKMKSPLHRNSSLELLVELSARLGNDAAGLAEPIGGPFTHINWKFYSQGHKFGRFSNLSESEDWRVHFAFKGEPSTDRFLKTFHMLARLNASRADPRDEVEFDWEFVVRHLCEPPYFERTWESFREIENTDHLSCKEVVHEIRQQGITFLPLTLALEKFEQVALELEVYE